MIVGKVFLSLHARDFAALSTWWSILLERGWDREPRPSCHEWDLAGCVHFQVLDDPEGAGLGTVSLHVAELTAQVERLRREGMAVPDPVQVEGFDNLRFCPFTDPEGNQVGLLEGA